MKKSQFTVDKNEKKCYNKVRKQGESMVTPKVKKSDGNQKFEVLYYMKAKSEKSYVDKMKKMCYNKCVIKGDKSL